MSYNQIRVDNYIKSMLKTPTGFYRRVNQMHPERIVKDKYEDVYDLGNIVNTPDDFYDKQESEFKQKVSNGKNKIFNPNTQRWILDTNRARESIRIQSSKKSSNTKTIKKKKTQPNKTLDQIIEDESYELEENSPLYDEGLTLEYCSKYNRNPTVNLDLIEVANQSEIDMSKININLSKSKNAKSITIPGFIKYKGRLLNNIEYISKGSFGTVFKYYSDYKILPGWIKTQSSKGDYYYYNPKIKDSATFDVPIDKKYKFIEVAIKTYNNSRDDEIGYVNKLNDNSLSGTCNLINSRILKLKNKNKITISSVMDLMDGTLYDLIKLHPRDKFIVFKKIAETLKCLQKKVGKDIIYTDLKLANILYKCYKNNKLKIVIGDIGGLCGKPSERGSSTYPSPETINDGANCDEPSMVWSLGVLLLELFNYDTISLFYWNSAKKMSLDTYIERVESSIDEFISIHNFSNRYSSLIKKIFDWDMYDRASLNYIIESI